MARPAKFDRDEALGSALDIVWLEGVERASVKHLSEQLGMTRSSFYNAFGSRDDFLSEVIQRYSRQSPDSPLHQPAEGPIVPLIADVFRAICKARGEDPQSRGCLVVNMVCDQGSSDDGPGQQAGTMIQDSVERFTELISQAKRRGELPDSAKPRPLALALQSLMLGINVLAKAGQGEADLWLTAEQTLVGLGLLAGPEAQ